MTAPPRCPVCDAPVSVTRTVPRELTHDSVAGLLEPGLVLTCDQHGPSAMVIARDAALDTAAKQLPRARRCRLRRTCCAACRAVLLLPVRRARRSLTVATPGVPIHTIHLDLPMTRCPECGIDQVPWRSQEDLSAVLGALYDPDA